MFCMASGGFALFLCDSACGVCVVARQHSQVSRASAYSIQKVPGSKCTIILPNKQ